MGEDRAWDSFCLFLFLFFYTVVSQQPIQKQLAVLILPKLKLYMGVTLSFLWQPKHFYFQNQKSLGFFFLLVPLLGSGASANPALSNILN